MKNPKYLSYTYYYNNKRKRTKGLSARSIEQARVEEKLINFFEKELRISEAFYTWAKLHLKELQDQELEEDKKRANIQQKELKNLKDKKGRLRELFIEQIITKEEFQDDLKKIEKQISTKEAGSEYAENWYEHIEELLNTILKFDEIIKNGSYSEKRYALEMICPNLIWNEQDLLVIKEDWLKEFIKGRNMVLKQYPMFEPKNSIKFKGLNDVLDVRCPTLLAILLEIRRITCKK